MTSRAFRLLRRGVVLAALLTPYLAAPSWAFDEVRGLVLDAEGRPIEGAAVSLVASVPLWQELAEAEEALRTEGAAAFVDHRRTPRSEAATVTDADGRYALALPRMALWTLRVEAEGHVPFHTHLPPVLPAIEIAPLHLPPNRGATIRVVDVEGEPVAGALVGIRGKTATRDRWSPAWPFYALTGPEGRAEITVPAKSEGRAQVRVQVRAARLDATGLVALSPARPLRGDALLRLRPTREQPLRIERDGRALAGVIVAGPFLPRAVTGEEGAAQVALEATETESLLLVAEDGRATWRPAPAARGDGGTEGQAEAEAGTETEAATGTGTDAERVEVDPDPVVEGRVVDAQGVGIYGAVVWQPPHPALGDGSHAPTRRDGGFELRLPRLEEGEKRLLFAAADGYRPTSRQLYLPLRDPRHLVLHPSTSVEVQIADGAGRPLPDARVEIYPSGRTLNREASLSREPLGVDADGRLEIRHLAPSRTYRAVVGAPGFASLRTTFRTAAHRELAEPILWTLRPALVVEGRVVSGEGEDGGAGGANEGVAGAEVRLEDVEPRSDRGREGRTRSDEDGSFRLDDLDSTTYELRISADEEGTAVRQVDLREAEAGTTVDLGEISLDPGKTLRGRVVDDRGMPYDAVTVFVQSADRSFHLSVRTDEEGRFEADGVPERGEIRVSVAGFVDTSGRLTLQPPWPEEVEIVLERKARITGRVVDRDGEPVPFASINILVERTDLSSSRGDRADDEGRFEVGRLEHGEALISASTADGVRGELRTMIEPGAVITGLEVVVEPGLEIVGRVENEDGAPIVGARIRYSHIPSLGEERNSGFTIFSSAPDTDVRGAFVVRDLQPGTYTLHVRAEGYEPASREVNVPGHPAEVVIRLEKDHSVDVEGRILVDGRPLTGGPSFAAGVKAWHLESGAEREAELDAEGRFRLLGIEPGRHLLRVFRWPGPGGEPAFFHQEIRDLEASSTLDWDLQSTILRGRVEPPRAVDLEIDDGVRPFSWSTDGEGKIVEIALGFAGPIRLRVEGTETDIPFRLAPAETNDLGVIVAPPGPGAGRED